MLAAERLRVAACEQYRNLRVALADGLGQPKPSRSPGSITSENTMSTDFPAARKSSADFASSTATVW
jgi:hypothetical protein